MNLRRFISRLLAVLVIAGLVAAPLVMPAAAKHMPIAGMADMSTMSGDMTCCPDRQKHNGCRDCPLAAMCMLTIAQAEPPLPSSVPTPLPTRNALFLALDDLIVDGLIGSPPDHPPRTSI